MLRIHTRNFDPLSRSLKIALGEKKASFHAIEAPEIGADNELIAIDKEGRTPILIDDMWGDGIIIREAFPSFEYIEDIIPFPPFFPGEPMEKAKVREFCMVHIKGFNKLLKRVREEKIHKIINKAGAPDSGKLKTIRDDVREYADYIGHIANKSGFMVGEKLSLADILIFSQLSILDYLDLIVWENPHDKYLKATKNFYLNLKQRPAFRAILNEVTDAINPPPHYKILDF